MTRKPFFILLRSLPFFAIFLFSANPVSEKQFVSNAVPLVVPEGFTIEPVVDPSLISYPMFGTFDETGRLFLFESTGTNNMGTAEMLKNPTYHVRVVEDTDGDGVYDRSHVFADKIPIPMGGVFYKGSLYVAESPNLVKYTDTDNDGKADKREVLLTGWVLHSNAATLSGPFLGPDGWFYMPDARRSFDIVNKEGVHLKGKGARIWRCRPDGTGLEWVSGGGFDNAIELAFMPSGETIGTMTYFTDPQGGFRDALMHWVEGGVYPKPNPVIAEDKLKLTGSLMPVMSKTARVAPSGLMRMDGDVWGKSFKGNLFSAEFNTGRIIRHEVKQEGATYSTVDTPFMTSQMADSHPTDVFMDADGSMLVLLTGGWFIEGCPLSRVAKPEVVGGIFRIRKKGVAPVADAWGNKINWSSQTTAQLQNLLADARPAVRSRAVEKLVDMGDAGITALKMRLSGKADEEEAARLVFALSRIGTPKALAEVRKALGHKSATVRTAAVRALGLAKDKASLAQLSKMVISDVAQVRRQAATALEQIGDPSAVPALLKAADKVEDRFEEHAIIHALITLEAADPVIAALNNPSEKVKKAALIVLDQMENSPLTREHLKPFLNSSSEELRNTGIWVADHRPEWTDIVVDFIEGQFAKSGQSEEELLALRDLMVTFCKNEVLQKYVTSQLHSGNLTGERKLLFLSVMGRCDVRSLPSTWSAQLGELLSSSDQGIVTEVLNLVQSRRVGGLTDRLMALYRNQSTSPALRLKALAASATTAPEISEADFNQLADLMKQSKDAAVSQAAANVLSSLKLNELQLKIVAEKMLPQADQFVLRPMLEVFAKDKNEKVGLSLVQSLSGLSDKLTNLPAQELQRILDGYSAAVVEKAKPLTEMLQKQQAQQQGMLAKIASELTGGDVLEGRKLFFGKSTCSTCHAVTSEGGTFGPDLTNIGDIRSRFDILEAIFFPSASFAREYETVSVTTSTGTLVGIITEQTDAYLILTPGPGAHLRLERSDVKSIAPHNMSMMPQGLQELLSKKELSDLMAFLESLPDGIKAAY